MADDEDRPESFTVAELLREAQVCELKHQAALQGTTWYRQWCVARRAALRRIAVAMREQRRQEAERRADGNRHR